MYLSESNLIKSSTSNLYPFRINQQSECKCQIYPLLQRWARAFRINQQSESQCQIYHLQQSWARAFFFYCTVQYITNTICIVQKGPNRYSTLRQNKWQIQYHRIVQTLTLPTCLSIHMYCRDVVPSVCKWEFTLLFLSDMLYTAIFALQH